MDRYEYKVRIAQIKSLIENGEFFEALQIVNTIDWRRVRSIQTLCMVSEIYKVNRKYDEARDVLMLAYNRYPGARSVVYALCELAIKTNRITEAVHYLKEFMKIANGDSGMYVLQYKLYESQGVGIEERIEVLKKLKSLDYQEKWAYELAKLYHEDGQESQCVAECDEMIVWFGHGSFVTKAMELKMLHTPLTPEQQKRYDHRNDLRRTAAYLKYEEAEEEESYPEEAPVEEPVKEAPESPKEEIPIEIKKVEASNQPTKKIPQKEIEAQLRAEDIKIHPVNLDKFSTMNLQAELKKNMAEFAAKTGVQLREVEMPIEPAMPVESANEPIKLTVAGDEEIPEENAASAEEEVLPLYDVTKAPIEIPKETETADEEEEIPETSEVVDEEITESEETAETAEAESVPAESEENEEEPENGLGADADYVSDETGRIDLDGIMEAWNRNAEQHEKARIARAKIKSLEQTNDIVSELVGVIPGVTTAPIPEIPEEALEEPVLSDTDMTELSPELTEESADSETEAETSEMKRETLEETTDLSGVLTGKIPVTTGGVFAGVDEEAAEESDPEQEEEVQESKPNNIIYRRFTDTGDDEDDEEIYPVQEASEENGESAALEEAEELPAAEMADDDEDEDEDYVPRRPVIAPEIRIGHSKKYIAPSAREAEGFNEDEKEIFAEFLSAHGLPEEIRETVDGMAMQGNTGNVVITGNEQSIRVKLAQALARGWQAKDDSFEGKIACIDANKFNTKNVEKSLNALNGGILVIAHAGDLEDSTLLDLKKYLENPEAQAIVILEENNMAARRMEKNFGWFEGIFNQKIDIPTYTNDDLVFHGREYARGKEYTIDDMGVLALYTRIDEMQTADHFVTVDEVEEIVDQAIRHADRRTPQHFIDLIVGKRYDDNDLIVLREKDFARG